MIIIKLKHYAQCLRKRVHTPEVMMVILYRCIFFIECDQILEKYDGNWNKASKSVKENLIANTSTIKNF